MSQLVKIVECPRDAWQGLPGFIPTQRKADYLHTLVDAGFIHIDAVSFVSPAAVPQMADSEAVLKILGPQKGLDIIAIVVNEKGANRAIGTRAVQTLGFPYSVSAEFLRRNQNQTPKESLDALHSIIRLSRDAGLKTVAYLSMAFGNPYGAPWSLADVVIACRQLVDLGVTEISLADTVGLSTPAQISDTLISVHQACKETEIGLHLHARRDAATEKIQAAYHAGCRRFDSAIAGLGGCPFAQDRLVGNIPTEVLIAELKGLGALLPQLKPLDGLVAAATEIARIFSQEERS